MTDESLRDIAAETLGSFKDHYIPIPESRIIAAQRCLKLVEMDPTSIIKHTVKRRAHLIMCELWKRSAELSILVALSVTPTQLGSLKSETYLGVLIEWWDAVPHPKGLTEFLEVHSDILPHQGE